MTKRAFRIGGIIAVACMIFVLISCSSTTSEEPLEQTEDIASKREAKISEEYIGSWLVAASGELIEGERSDLKAEDVGVVSVAEDSVVFYEGDHNDSAIESKEILLIDGNIAIEFNDGSYGTFGTTEPGITTLIIGSSIDELEQLNAKCYFISRYNSKPGILNSSWDQRSEIERQFLGSWEIEYVIFDGQVFSKEEIVKSSGNLLMSVHPGGLAIMENNREVVMDRWSIVGENMVIVDAEDGSELEFTHNEETPQELEERIETIRNATERASYNNREGANALLHQAALVKREPSATREYLTIWYDDFVEIFGYDYSFSSRFMWLSTNRE